MNSLNKVMLIGRIVNKPSLRATNSGTPVTNFSIETEEVWSDRKTHAERHDITAFGKMAKTCVDNGTVGSVVYIEGKMQAKPTDTTSAYPNKTNVLAHAVRFFETTGTDHQKAQKGQNDDHQPPRRTPRRVTPIARRVIPPFLMDRSKR